MASRMASGALPVASAAAGDLAGRVKLVPGSMEGCESALPFADLNLVAAQEIGEIAPEFIEGGLNFPGADDDEVGSGPLIESVGWVDGDAQRGSLGWCS